MVQLSSHEALKLTASFACAAERIRSAEEAEVQARATLCEIASRVAFLRAHKLAKGEEIRPILGETFRRAAFAIA